MTATLPYPTDLSAPLAGQKDAKDATGRIDTWQTAGGLPVVCLNPFGAVWLVTFQTQPAPRRAWVIGEPAPVLNWGARLALHPQAEHCTGIDELLSDEVTL